MKRFLFALICAACLAGCQKSAEEPAPLADAGKTASPNEGGGGVGMGTPDVGATTPVDTSALDAASGSGVGSAAMAKAKGVAAGGVGSVNNAERQGYGAEGGE